jgi:tetratricopeptide (TPR) repeat protein
VAAGHCGLADALARLGKFGEAEAEYRHALVLKPNLVPALHNLARLMFEKGDTLQALELSVRLLASHESDDAKRLFVDCLRAGWLPKPIAGLAQTLVCAIKERWLRPSEVIGLGTAIKFWVAIDRSVLLLGIRRCGRLTGVAIGRTVAILVASAIAILRARPIGRAVMTLGTVYGLFLF